MSGSMKDALKALNTAFSTTATPPYPLPDELCTAIEGFLERYETIDDHDSQRFHEDLHALYLRHIADSPDKHGAFLAVLRMVRPAITGEARLFTWYDLVVGPVIERIGNRRREIEDAREFVHSILVYDSDEDHDGQLARLSSVFAEKILQAYLARTDLFASNAQSMSADNEVIANELETVLITFGRKMPKVFISALDHLFVQKQHRIQVLNLLSAFVRLQPPHLHLVLETSLIQNLERCLLIDTSATVIDLALVVLIMFLPHICGALTSDHHLEKLFLIYCRVLCWEKLSSPETKKDEEHFSSDDSDEEGGGDDQSESAWEQCEQSAEYSDTSPPSLLHYFTFLYGLFPLNFLSFVHKPRRYLKSLNFPGAREFDLDQDFIHSRTEPYRKLHLLHPNMFNSTVEDELSNNRWLRSDPADVVIECMDLCVAASSTLQDPGPPPNSALPPVPDMAPLLTLDHDGTTMHGSEGSWRNTQSTMYVPLGDNTEGIEATPSGQLLNAKSVKSAKSYRSLVSPSLKSRDMMDSPTLPPTSELPNQDLLGQDDSTSKQVANQSSLDDFAHSVSGTTSPTHQDFQNHTMGSLQREIMLLRNDLNFERYLKLQHLTHIGQLQRNNIKDATAEANTQNLINTNKTLKAKLAKANEQYAQLKKETLTSRSQSKKWEGDLSAKVRTYKENEKSWHNEQGSLRHDLNRTQSDYDKLKQIVEKAEAEQLKAQQRTTALEYELEDYGNVRRELEAAQEKLLAFEDQRKELQGLHRERIDLRNDLEISHMRFNSREAERDRAIKAYERRIMELEARLQTSDRDAAKSGQLPLAVQQMLDSTLAASNAKLQQLKKIHHRLVEQHTELQMKCYELEAEKQAEAGQLYSQTRAEQLDTSDPRMSRNSSFRAASRYNTGSLPPLVTDNSQREQYHAQEPLFLNSPVSAASPARPTRYESLQAQKPPQRSQTTPLPYPGFGGGLGPDFSAAYDSSLSNQYQSRRAGNGAHSSGKSSFSVDTDGSNSKDAKDKVDVKSEVRVFGRGGAQNIGKKVKDKEKDKDQKKSSSKTGGFRGLKGIM